MQMRESKFVLDTVCEHLRKHHPDTPIITVHDSIMTTPAHVSTVLRVLNKHFEQIGFVPSLHVENPNTAANAA